MVFTSHFQISFNLRRERVCPGSVVTPGAHNYTHTITTIGKYQRPNQMQIERALAAGNFQFSPLAARCSARLFPGVWLPEKQTGIDFLSPRVFPPPPLWGGGRVGEGSSLAGVCVLLIIFPRLGGAFSDNYAPSFPPCTHTHTHAETRFFFVHKNSHLFKLVDFGWFFL